MDLFLIFIIFIVGAIMFYLLAVGFRLMINRLLGKHVERYVKGGFLSDLENKEKSNERN